MAHFFKKNLGLIRKTKIDSEAFELRDLLSFFEHTIRLPKMIIVKITRQVSFVGWFGLL